MSLGILPVASRFATAQDPPDPRELVRLEALSQEDWSEPWVWRPADWANESLDLQVVGHAHPARRTGPGNSNTPLFSYNGSTPAPTIRMRGDERLQIRLRNLLGRNTGAVPIGPSPFFFQIPLDWRDEMACRIAESLGRTCDPDNPPGFDPVTYFGEILRTMNVELVDTALLSVPVNMSHASHTTNLHTHGLHVEPETNPNGTASDNVLLRVIPREDYEARQQSADPAFRTLSPNERVGSIDLEHRLGDVGRARRIRDNRAPEPHPPGTHWYHPHSHGSTFDQVGSGMAGFLIVEGDVDDAINRRMTGTERPDPTLKSGPFDYRERLVMLQKVEIGPLDYDRGPGRNQLGFAASTNIGGRNNGVLSPPTMFMRPGAIERWRVLNASVDGFGVKNFMVLEGQYDVEDNHVWRVLPREDSEDEQQFERMSRQDVEDAKVGLYQLSLDGITLVSVEDGRARYAIRDLSNQNAGTRNPFDPEPREGESTAEAVIRGIEACYRDGDSLRNLFVRPNQVHMANANRADVLFKAPLDANGKVYTILAQGFVMNFDNVQRGAQMAVRNARPLTAFNARDNIIGYVKITGAPVPGGDFDVMSLNGVLPDVPPSLHPITDDELRIPEEEAARRGVPAGEARTRVLSYSGFGAGDMPLIEVPEAFAAAHPELRKSVWDEIDGVRVLLPYVTMAINADFDLAANPAPGPPHKFGHGDTDPHARPLVDTAEEWVVYNCTMSLWGHTDLERYPQPGHYRSTGTTETIQPHYTAYPLTRAEGQARFAADPEFLLVTRAVDHPFHIHINPCWVLRIEVPDEQGRLHNILPEPCWMDTVSIPRDGGRIVFRSRCQDYVGTWVHHCHTLLHEDFGMMQLVECVARPEDANYRTRRQPATADMATGEVDAVYPRPSRAQMYRQNMSFVDTHPLGGYTFPGFEIEVPELEE